MKPINRWFVAGVLVFLLIIFLFQLQMPRKFVWSPTFDAHDENPFGCAVFDSVCRKLLPRGYEVSDKFLSKLFAEDSTGRRNILLVAKRFDMDSVDIASLRALAAAGSRVMIVMEDAGYHFEDSFSISFGYGWFSASRLQHLARDTRDTLVWTDTRGNYSERMYGIHSELINTFRFLNADTLRVIPIVRNLTKGEDRYFVKDGSENEVEEVRFVKFTHALSMPYGKGEIIMVSMPLLFTNYGILDDSIRPLLLRLVSLVSDRPLVRTQAYNNKKDIPSESPLKFILKSDPLRSAFYMLIAGIFLFMLFTAKRRQRVIPVAETPVNRELEFVKLIGTLYFQRKDHTDLVKKRFAALADTFRREMQVDILEATDDERTFARVAGKTGIEVDEIAALIRELRTIDYGARTLTQDEMKKYIARMNKITESIN